MIVRRSYEDSAMNPFRSTHDLQSVLFESCCLVCVAGLARELPQGRSSSVAVMVFTVAGFRFVATFKI